MTTISNLLIDTEAISVRNSGEFSLCISIFQPINTIINELNGKLVPSCVAKIKKLLKPFTLTFLTIPVELIQDENSFVTHLLEFVFMKGNIFSSDFSNGIVVFVFKVKEGFEICQTIKDFCITIVQDINPTTSSVKSI